ncbi:MAG: serine--tRNA ligase [Candidatus Sungiibacteriota bacterium]
MLDIKFIRQNRKEVEEGLKAKGAKIDIGRLLDVDEKKREKIKLVDDLRAEHNRASDEIASLKGESREDRIAEVKDLKVKLGNAEFEMKALDEEFNDLMYQLPNLPLADVPIGKNEAENKVLRTWGEPGMFEFEPRDHVVIGQDLGILDIEQAGKVVGTRFAYLKGELAVLEFALIQFTLERLTSAKIIKKIADTVSKGYDATPFVPVIPPVMIKPEIFKKMARLSEKDKDERYYLPQDDLYLVGSAEHTMGPLHMDETMEEDRLPLRYLGFSTSFRREAGSYGKDTRGILRVHQFDKLEMESFTLSENSTKEQDFIVALQEHLVRLLGIPYRVVIMCTGDMGAPDARQVDIEMWMPGQGRYRETHTSDLMTDFQARRLNTKVRRKDGSVEFVHMNDATAFAIGRTLIAILENYQQADGSVRIPEILQPYTFGLKEIKR